MAPPGIWIWWVLSMQASYSSQSIYWRNIWVLVVIHELLRPIRPNNQAFLWNCLIPRNNRPKIPCTITNFLVPNHYFGLWYYFLQSHGAILDCGTAIPSFDNYYLCPNRLFEVLIILHLSKGTILRLHPSSQGAIYCSEIALKLRKFLSSFQANS